MRTDIKKRLLDILNSNPDFLFMTPDELEENSDIAMSVWEDFLDEPDVKRIIEKKLAKRSEIAARKALKKLEKGHFNTQEVSALKQLIDNSKLLQQRANNQEKVIVMFIPPYKIQRTEEIANG